MRRQGQQYTTLTRRRRAPARTPESECSNPDKTVSIGALPKAPPKRQRTIDSAMEMADHCHTLNTAAPAGRGVCRRVDRHVLEPPFRDMSPGQRRPLAHASPTSHRFQLVSQRCTNRPSRQGTCRSGCGATEGLMPRLGGRVLELLCSAKVSRRRPAVGEWIAPATPMTSFRRGISIGDSTALLAAESATPLATPFHPSRTDRSGASRRGASQIRDGCKHSAPRRPAKATAVVLCRQLNEAATTPAQLGRSTLLESSGGHASGPI